MDSGQKTDNQPQGPLPTADGQLLTVLRLMAEPTVLGVHVVMEYRPEPTVNLRIVPTRMTNRALSRRRSLMTGETVIVPPSD